MEKIFARQKVFFPVIHVVDRENALKNAEIAIEANVDGIFLISHGYFNHESLISLGKEIKQLYPQLWIGYNFLDLKTKHVFETLDNLNFFPDGIWIDNSMVGITGLENDLEHSNEQLNKYIRNGFSGIYFGGVAFKYQKQPYSLSEACKESNGRMDVITTSGKGTGLAADINKIKTMHKTSSEIHMPLAIASGIDISNVDEFLPYIDAFLVSSSISINHRDLDMEKTKTLCNKIKGI